MDSAKWAFRWLGKQRWRVYAGLFFVVLGIAMLMVEPFIFRGIIDDVLIGGQYDRLLPMLLLSLAFGVGFLVLRYLNNIFWDLLAQIIYYGLRKELFVRLLGRSSSFFRQNASGDLITKCTGDADMVRHFIAWVFPRVFEYSFMLLTVLTIFFVISPLYALSLFALTPFTAFLGIRLGKRIRPAHNAVREQRARLSSVVNENIGGNRVVKAFVREDFETKKFTAENEGFRDAQLEVNRIWLRYAPLLESVAQILGVVNLAVGALLVISGRITLGQMSIFLTLAWALNEPMSQIGPVINDAQRFFASAEKLMLLYYHPQEIKSPDNPVRPDRIRGDIQMAGVSLRIGGVTVLQDINLSIKAGQTVGFMGPTGSGKTLLASLVPRMIDVTGGAVLVDGVNVEHYDLRALRGAVGMTMQDVFLFSASVEDNIAYGRSDAPSGEIARAAEIADAHRFVSKMPEGYATIVGERGTGLSGGQKQRISLARALLPRPSVLILDDITSAVDMETEKIIQQRLCALPERVTTIIVAQRVSSLTHADRIYILDQGRIVEQGTHGELMELGGYYYETCLLQQGADTRKEA